MSEFDGIDVSDFQDFEPSTKPQTEFDGIDLSDIPDATESTKTTLGEAFKVNPDQRAKVNKLATQVGTSPEIIEQDLPGFEMQTRLNSLDLSKNPGTNKFLENYDNAAVAHDDIGVLTQIENVLQSIPAGFLSGTGMAFEGAGRAVQSVSNMAARGLDKVLPDSANRFIYDQKNSPETLKMINTIAPSNLLAQEGQGLKDTAEFIGVSPEEQNLATDIAAGIGQVGGQILTRLLAGPAVSAGALFAQGADQQGEKQEATGTEGSSNTSDLAVLTGGGVTAVTEKIGLEKLLDRIPPAIRNKILRQTSDLTIAGGIEAVQETTENLAQDLIELNTTNEDAQVLDGAGREALAAGGTAAIVRGIINALTPGRVADRMNAEQEVTQQRSEMEQATLDQLETLATESKLRQRDPEAFKQSIQDMDGDQNRQVYMDGVQTKLYLADKNINSDPALQLLAQKADEAAALGTDIAIPLPDFTSTIAGSEHFAALRDTMTMSADSIAPFRQEQIKTEQENYVRDLMNEAETNVSSYVESQEIFEKVKSQLIDSGVYSPANASVMAQLVPAAMQVYARKNNLSVQEAYQRSGLVIEGPQTGKLESIESNIPLPPKEKIDSRLQANVDRRLTPDSVEIDNRKNSERRKDQGRREAFSKLSPEEQYKTAYANPLTNLPGKRAFEEDLINAKEIISIDIDSLKTVNDNLSPDAGDNLLKKAANALFAELGDSVYHTSGDEFYLLANTKEEVEKLKVALDRAAEKLKSEKVEDEKGVLEGIAFTYGAMSVEPGDDVKTIKRKADLAMKEEKASREARGERAGRGVVPKNLRFFQQAQGTRGYFEPKNSLIRLTEAADLSTFIHEFAHFVYELEVNSNSKTITSINNWYKRNKKDVAREAGQTEEDVVNFLDNKTTGDDAKDADIRRAVHEQFARGFEAYVMEGKAPSLELRNAFQTFARWLTQIYKSIKNLNVKLDDEMRQVFDRLIATEEQIALAEARMKYQPLFKDDQLTPEELDKYKAKQEKVKDKQAESLRDKLIKEITRQKKDWWKQEKADLVDQELKKLKEEKVYKAANVIKDNMKLDHGIVRDMVGTDRVDRRGIKSRRIPQQLNGLTITGGKGVHPDIAAGMLGYGSGDELITDLVNAESILDVAERNAESEMIARHGDILNDGTIQREADDAIHNEERGELLLEELKLLRRGTNARVIERSVLKGLAEENIAKLSYREIYPQKYRKAEIRAAQEAVAFLANGKMEEAAGAKTRQLMNFYLGNAATEAQNKTVKIVDRMARYEKKSVKEEILKAEGGYWEQIEKILNRFEFRKSATMKQVDKVNQDINTWMTNRNNEEGDALVLSPAVLDETYVTHWKNVKFGDLQGIDDSVRNIEHVARYSNKIQRLGEQLDFKQLVDRWTDHMEKSSKTRFTAQRTDVAQGKNWGRWAMAGMTKIPFMASWLDGNERAGMSHDILVQPMTDAFAAEKKLWEDVGNVVLKAINSRSKEARKRDMKKYFIPELKDEKNDGNLYGHQLIAVALNTGNEGNLRKMLRGENWAKDDTEVSIDNPKLQAVLSKLTKEDWDLVQLIWDQMDILYPKLAEVHRKTTGLVPPKVQATPVKTAFGTFRGGYYPVKYDPERDDRAKENEDKLDAQIESMFNTVGSIQASVNASATNERTKYFAPVRLSLDVVSSHFQETIHYITHHDAVRETNKLIKNGKVRDVIRSKLGPEELAQLKPWLNSIAKDGRETTVKTYIDKVLQRLRFGMTLGTMGFKASTGIMQLLGTSNIVAEVGLANTLQAYRSILGSPKDIKSAWEFASENSKILKYRTETMDREIKNAMTKLSGKTGWMAAVQEASMKHIALIQTYMVDLPTWHAAYIKSMKEYGDEARAYKYADFAVENIQGSGATKDLAQIMNGQSESHKIMTMFMTFFSSLWNMERDLVKGAKSGAYSPTTVAAKLMFLMFIPVVAEMFIRGEFGDEEDEEVLAQKTLTKLALYPVASLPGVRDIAGGFFGDYGYNMSPIASLLEQGIGGSSSLAKNIMTDEEVTASQLKATSKLLGAALGVPGTGQAWATGEGLYNIMENGEDITARELLLGPKK